MRGAVIRTPHERRRLNAPGGGREHFVGRWRLPEIGATLSALWWAPRAPINQGRDPRLLRPLRAGETTMSPARFPIERTVEPAPNDARLEFIFDCCEGQPPARQKRLILRARSNEIGFLDHQQAEQAMVALGLKEA